jgi:hypothetical protein
LVDDAARGDPAADPAVAGRLAVAAAARDTGPVAWVARIAAYGYAAFNSVTDVLVGIGAGAPRLKAADWNIAIFTTEAVALA